MEALIKNSKKIALSFILLTIICYLAFVWELTNVDYSFLGFFKTLATYSLPFYSGYEEIWDFSPLHFYFFVSDSFYPYLNLLISVFLYLKYFKMNDNSRILTILLFIKIIGFISLPIYVYIKFENFYFPIALDNYPFTTVSSFLIFVITIFLTIITLNPDKGSYVDDESYNAISESNMETKEVGEIKLNGNKQALTVGDWFLIKFITYIPLVNIVMYCIWAFSSNNSDEVKSNFAKASLIWMVINTVLYFLFLGSLINSLLGF